MRLEKKRLTIYLVLVFVLTWAYEFSMIWPIAGDGLANPMVQALVMGAMFFPAVSMLLTRMFTREGFSDLRIRLRFRGNAGRYLLAYFGPGILVLLGAAVYYLVFPGKLDWSAPYLRQAMAAAGNPYETQAVPMNLLLLIQVIQALLLSGLLNLIPSLGEEWGWRGYMMPLLRQKMKPVPALLTGGVIWGLWHAPITALGHNYGAGYPGFPWAGIGAMCVFCVACGILLTWLTEKTGSCLPAAIAHGAINGCAALGLMVSADGGDPFVGPVPTGIIGGLPFLLLAIWALIWFARGEKKDA